MRRTRLDRTAARKLASTTAHTLAFVETVTSILAEMEDLRRHLEGEEAGAFQMAYQGLLTLKAMRAGEAHVAPRLALAAINGGKP